jgi:mono/diheme cytochrome c family protein
MQIPWINVVVNGAIIASAFLAVRFATAADLVNPEEQAKSDFINYCAACHGVNGTGDGPVAPELKSQPSNLTVLSKNNDGHFPYLRLVRVIDGEGSTTERYLRAHGSREMPVWGEVFRKEASSYSRYVNAQAKIMNIVDYIASIQE